ncbi:dioxygenase [Mesorhizobium sp. J428]|uniref:dioxygenase n=1 Tax=Mesorhizobium sp. J428 TaxID=2898440 RepID=UPI0027E2BF4D|nr:dioxygenase [Mesorhizobium sp. J428]
MDGNQHRLHRGGTSATGQMASEDFAARLATRPASRLSETVGALVASLNRLADELGLTASEFHAATDFLTEVGHYADSRRQEWVLLADVLGLSSHIEDLNHRRPAGATPNTIAGPFYRADVPEMPAGANISRDGKGEPLSVSGRVVGLSGEPLAGALVEVWQANGDGK